MNPAVIASKAKPSMRANCMDCRVDAFRAMTIPVFPKALP